jgi:glucose-6-phosphate 1-dehydrogenase
VRGQYRGYLDVDGVAPDSTVETYVAVRLAVDSWRWAGVPVVIRAGKCLPVTATEVLVRFRTPPQNVFGLDPPPAANALRFRVWPETAVGLTLAGKRPGGGLEPQTDELAFAQRPGSDMRPYDRLIGAALDGDRWLFSPQETVESAWRIVDPVLGGPTRGDPTRGDPTRGDAVPLHVYDRGTWGPPQADALLPAGDSWHDPA